MTFRAPLFYVCLLLACLRVSPVSAQTEKDSLQNGLLLRGKVFGFVVIEDWWITSMTIGTEYRFAKHHSFGIDFVFFKHRYEQEQYNYPADPDKYDEYSQHNPRLGLLVDYRYYIEPRWIRKKKFTPYLNPFCYAGHANVYNDSKWHYAEGDVVRQKEKFVDLGGTLGMRFCLGKVLNLDIGMGMAKRYKNEDVEYWTPSGPNRFVENQRVEQNVFIWRLNLSGYLFVKKYGHPK